MYVVAGDIGGTSARLALFGAPASVPQLLARATYPGRAHPGIAPILTDFLSASSIRPSAIALGVAGPVRGGAYRTTNLPWLLSNAAITEWALAGSDAVCVEALDPDHWTP